MISPEFQPFADELIRRGEMDPGMERPTKDTSPCQGCRDDPYNHGLHGVTECWHLKSAKIVTRYRIGWWTAPTQPGAFEKVKTYDCHSAPGRYANYETLPDCAIEVKQP